MKRGIIVTLAILVLHFSSYANFEASQELDNTILTAGKQIDSILDEKGEDYRNDFLNIIREYQIQYAYSEEALYILSYLLEYLSSSAQSPNILLIIADDMGLDASPGYDTGGSKAPMPHLENMIENGLVFENLWTAPTCTPTRGTMLTGKYGIRTNVLAVDDPLSLEETPLQNYLPDEYEHAVIGKWHLSKDADHPNDIGIDYYAGMLSGGVKSYWDWTLTENGAQSSQDEYITSKFTDLAIDWLDEQEDNPWFLWLAYTSPHTPFHLPPNNLHSSDDLDPSDTAIETNPLPYYHAMLESLDTEIGRLLDSMTSEERDNTLIIFMGDNGTPGQVVQTPYEKRKAKGSLYEGGINTPLIVSGAGLTRTGERETALINSVDMFATILDLAGTEQANMHDSISFVPLLTNTNTNTRDFAYGEVGGEGRQAGHTIRDEQYKYLKLDSGRDFFYDLLADPYEEDNLINNGLSEIESTSLENLKNTLGEIRE